MTGCKQSMTWLQAINNMAAGNQYHGCRYINRKTNIDMGVIIRGQGLSNVDSITRPLGRSWSGVVYAGAMKAPGRD